MTMTVKEAASVLSGVVNSFRAAKRLEEALKTAEGAEQIIKEKTATRDSLEAEIIQLHSKLDALGQEVETEQRKKDSLLAESSRVTEEARMDAKSARASADEKIKEAEESASEKFRLLDASHLALIEQLDKEIEDRRVELASTEAILQKVKGELASIKEGLD